MNGKPFPRDAPHHHGNWNPGQPPCRCLTRVSAKGSSTTLRKPVTLTPRPLERSAHVGPPRRSWRRRGMTPSTGSAQSANMLLPTTPVRPVSPPPAVPHLLFPMVCALCLEPVCGGGPPSLGARRLFSRGGVMRLTPFFVPHPPVGGNPSSSQYQSGELGFLVFVALPLLCGTFLAGLSLTSCCRTSRPSPQATEGGPCY